MFSQAPCDSWLWECWEGVHLGTRVTGRGSYGGSSHDHWADWGTTHLHPRGGGVVPAPGSRLGSPDNTSPQLPPWNSGAPSKPQTGPSQLCSAHGSSRLSPSLRAPWPPSLMHPGGLAGRRPCALCGFTSCGPAVCGAVHTVHAWLVSTAPAFQVPWFLLQEQNSRPISPVGSVSRLFPVTLR